MKGIAFEVAALFGSFLVDNVVDVAAEKKVDICWVMD